MGALVNHHFVQLLALQGRWIHKHPAEEGERTPLASEKMYRNAFHLLLPGNNRKADDTEELPYQTQRENRNSCPIDAQQHIHPGYAGSLSLYNHHGIKRVGIYIRHTRHRWCIAHPIFQIERRNHQGNGINKPEGKAAKAEESIAAHREAIKAIKEHQGYIDFYKIYCHTVSVFYIN